MLLSVFDFCLLIYFQVFYWLSPLLYSLGRVVISDWSLATWNVFVSETDTHSPQSYQPAFLLLLYTNGPTAWSSSLPSYLYHFGPCVINIPVLCCPPLPFYLSLQLLHLFYPHFFIPRSPLSLEYLGCKWIQNFNTTTMSNNNASGALTDINIEVFS